jgi:hypothetical protein
MTENIDQLIVTDTIPENIKRAGNIENMKIV